MKNKVTIIAVVTLLVLVIALITMIVLGGEEISSLPDNSCPTQPDVTFGNSEEITQNTDATQSTEAPVATIPLSTDPSNPVYASEGVENWEEGATGGDGGLTTTPVVTQPTTETIGTEFPTWEQYLNMSTAEKQAFDISFGLDEAGRVAFFAWRDAAKAEYEKTHSNVTGDGNVNIEDFMGQGN